MPDLKDEIVNKSFFQFLNRGYKACSLKDLEKATGLTKGTGRRVYLLGIIQVVTKIRYTLYNNYLPTEPLDTDNNPFPTTR